MHSGAARDEDVFAASHQVPKHFSRVGVLVICRRCSSAILCRFQYVTAWGSVAVVAERGVQSPNAKGSLALVLGRCSAQRVVGTRSRVQRASAVKKDLCRPRSKAGICGVWRYSGTLPIQPLREHQTRRAFDSVCEAGPHLQAPSHHDQQLVGQEQDTGICGTLHSSPPLSCMCLPRIAAAVLGAGTSCRPCRCCSS